MHFLKDNKYSWLLASPSKRMNNVLSNIICDIKSLTDLVSWVRCLPKGVGNFCIPICYLKICWRKWCFQRQVLKNLCATTVWLRFLPSWTITQTHTLLSPQRLFVKYQSQIHKVSRWLHKVCMYSSQCYYMRYRKTVSVNRSYAMKWF